MQKAWSRTNQAGFTLVELLMYVALVGSLLTATSVLFATATSARIKSQSISEVEQQGSFAMHYVARTIRNATAVSAPAAGTTASTLTASVPTAALSPTIFSLSGTTLQVKEGAAAAIALTNNNVQVSNLSFKNLARSGTTETIQISFTLARTNTAGRNEYDYTKTFVTTAVVKQ